MDRSGPGAIVLIGSGETAAAGRAAMRWLAATGRASASICVLETPAGFEPNAEAVAARWTNAIRRQPEARGADIAQLPLRGRGMPGSPDDADLARPILGADLVALGAGSPTYAARQLRGSVAWEHARAAHLLGASLFLASAAAVASGAFALPVYEIYKVGDELHWKEGLEFFDLYGLRLAIVTHWDDRSGGEGLDTTCGFMGRERFGKLRDLLPQGVVVLGIDEHTALAIDPANATAEVLGRGGVTVIQGGEETEHTKGATVALDRLGPFAVPDTATAVPANVTEEIRAARADRAAAARPSEDVAALVRTRERARADRDFAAADELRARIAERGWKVEDTERGTRVVRDRT